MSNIAIFGDSIAFGLNDEDGGWVERLRRYFHVADKKYEINNFSVSGDDTEELLKRFKTECSISKTDQIIFAVGINDSLYISFEEFKRNLEILIDQAKKFTKDIVFIGLTPVDESKVAPIPWNAEFSYNNKNIRKFNDAIKDIAKKNKLKFIDTLDRLNKDDLDDGLHPNSIGHQKMFEVIKDNIRFK
ncbi:MAG: GDSL-type esterase/lipase family protein [Candidatus Paceibacterota bacterium]|jgi:lysophospholipase L1-like esterase